MANASVARHHLFVVRVGAPPAPRHTLALAQLSRSICAMCFSCPTSTEYQPGGSIAMAGSELAVPPRPGPHPPYSSSVSERH